MSGRPISTRRRRLWLLAMILAAACERSHEAVKPRAPETVDVEVAGLIAERTAEIERDPSSATAHGRLGLVYEANLMWLEARDAYSIAIELAPAEASWRLRRAVVMRSAGEPTEALAELRWLVERHPEDAAAQERLGHALLEQGDAEGARAAFAAVVRLAPGSPLGHTGLGEAQRRLGELEQAVASLERAVGMAPDYRAARYQLGLAYRALGRLEEAQRELTLGSDAIVSHLPDSWSAELHQNAMHRTVHVNRAAELLKADRVQEALAILESRLAEEPDSTKLLNKMAITLVRLGDLERAGQMLDRALALDDQELETHVNRARLALAQRRYDEALTSADRAVELGPGRADAHSMRARCLVALDRQVEAAQTLERALRLDPADKELYRTLARVYSGLGRDSDLEALLEGALDRWPDELGAHLGLARLAVQRGELDRAERHLAEARRISPQSRSLASLTRRLEMARRAGAGP